MKEIIIIIIFILGAVGWVRNLVKFVKLDFESPYKAEIIRGMSIAPAPVGAIIGWVNIKD